MTGCEKDRRETDNGFKLLSFQTAERRRNLFQFLFCLSRLPEATVMCFDQCHSGSVDRPAYHRRLPAGLRYHLYVCVCTCVCVWWQMRGGSHRARRDGADNLESLSLREAEPDVGTATCTTLSRHSVGFSSHLSALSDENTCTTHTHTHAHAVCTPGGIPKSFSANLRESLAPMLINVGRLGSQWREEIKRTQTENWGTVWGTKEILRSGDYENPSMKIYMTDQHKWRKYQNGVEKKKSRWRIKMELKWEKRCRKTGRGLLEQHVNHRRMWSYNEVGIWPAACRDPWNFKCRDFPLQQGRQLRRTHTLTRMYP